MTFLIPKVRLHHHQYPHPNLDTYPNVYILYVRKYLKTPHLCNKLEKLTSNLCDEIQSTKSLHESRLVANFAGNCNSKICNYIHGHFSTAAPFLPLSFSTQLMLLQTQKRQTCLTHSSTQCTNLASAIPLFYPPLFYPPLSPP